MDVCGVDYLQHGRAEWKTEHATAVGVQPRRGARHDERRRTSSPGGASRVVYHLLSIAHNQRLRLQGVLRGRRAARWSTR